MARCTPHLELPFESHVSGGPEQQSLGARRQVPAENPFSLTTTGRDPYMKNPLTDQFNAGIEYQVTGTTILAANYVGSRGRRIPTGSIWNTAVTPGPGRSGDDRHILTSIPQA